MITLVVPIDQFIQERQTRLPKQAVYLAETEQGVVITCGDPVTRLIIRCVTAIGPAETKKMLGEKGVAWTSGEWRDGTTEPTQTQAELPYMAAVSYHSAEAMPGCWVDAYRSSPTVQEVLKTLFEEFQTNGEINDVSFDEFMRLASPNVVIFSPDEIRYHLGQKDQNCP